MKKLLLLCYALLCLHTSVAGQQASSGLFNMDSFPKVSYLYHDNNPQILHQSDFRYFKEGNEFRDFHVKVIQENHPPKPQHTVILWEDMAVYGPGQFNFTRDILSAFFTESDIPVRDEFDIAVFNRRKNTPNVLSDLTDGFTSNKEKLRQCILQYKAEKERYAKFPYCSDMYSAVREAIDLLSSFDGVKCIILFTAGRSMINSGADSEAQVLLLAQRLHIPVYIFQYFAPAGVAAESEGFAKSSYGKFASYKDASTAKDDLVSLYPAISERYYGHTYQLTFKSKAKRGDDLRNVSFNVNGQEITAQFTPPVFSFKVWIKKHPILFSALVIILVALVVLLVLLLYHKRKVHESKFKGQITDIQHVQMEALEKKLEERLETLEVGRETVTGENTRISDTEIQEITTRLMHIKNLYPRLHCQTDHEQFVYNMQKPRITIGRYEDNDVVLPNDKVSRHHAEIVFNGKEFEIIDNHSTNKVIVNGNFFDRTVLKNGDTISLGEAIIVFYL